MTRVSQGKQVASTFAARVADARRALPRLSGTREVSQAEVAARTGWSQQRYSKIESGSQKTISVEDLQVLAAALDEDAYFLFTGLRTQNVGSLAARINRLELDGWGEDAVWETAQREARRYQEERAAAMKRVELTDEEAEVLAWFRASGETMQSATLEGIRSGTAAPRPARKPRPAKVTRQERTA